MNALTAPNNNELLAILSDTHRHIAQLDMPTRSLTARNYDSAIMALSGYLNGRLPTKQVLEQWRDDMVAGVLLKPDGTRYAHRSICARLAAIRKLLNSAADTITNIEVKFALRDWASVADPKEIIIQDKVEEDYGRRLSLASVQALLRSVPTHHIKGLRDRAIIALGVGAGLRISEIVNLTLADLYQTRNANGQVGIYVRDSKHHKSRVVVMAGWNSWVFTVCRQYTDAVQIDQTIMVGVSPTRNSYVQRGYSLSANRAAAAIAEYPAEYMGQMISINAHDLRRTYAKLCRMAGMTWDAIAANMGHGSITVTEAYVGKDVDWAERVPGWSIDL